MKRRRPHRSLQGDCSGDGREREDQVETVTYGRIRLGHMSCIYSGVVLLPGPVPPRSQDVAHGKVLIGGEFGGQWVIES